MSDHTLALNLIPQNFMAVGILADLCSAIIRLI